MLTIFADTFLTATHQSRARDMHRTSTWDAPRHWRAPLQTEVHPHAKGTRHD